jgi:hypothetical protein
MTGRSERSLPWRGRSCMNMRHFLQPNPHDALARASREFCHAAKYNTAYLRLRYTYGWQEDSIHATIATHVCNSIFANIRQLHVTFRSPLSLTASGNSCRRTNAAYPGNEKHAANTRSHPSPSLPEIGIASPTGVTASGSLDRS